MSDDSEAPKSKAGGPSPPKTKAEDNPWYLLATLYGVPDEEDRELRNKNRVAWNRYFAAVLNEQTRRTLIEWKRHPAEELTPFSPEELQEVAAAFAERCKASAKKLALPVSRAFIDFSKVEFEQYAFFTGYLFSRNSFFHGATFSYSTDFSGATFFVETSFNGATFSGSASFHRATFSGDADFGGATFSGNADFGGATFSRAYFPGRTFSRDGAYFGDATFSERANFGDATFSCRAYFGGATFSYSSDFSYATFSLGAYFRKATFFGPADFACATFFTAEFDDATFSERANFVCATFSGSADFGGASFSGDADFHGVTFSGEAYFTRARFHKASSFVYADMKKETSFKQAIFVKEPPHFFGAKLHEHTFWRGITWPPKPDKYAAGSFVDAYERLKLEMHRLEKHEDELDFFALEMESRRVLQGPVRGLPIALYGVLSGYSRSYVRPLVALFVAAAIGTGAFWYFDGRTYGEALALSVANTLNVFGFRKDFDLAIDTPLAWLKVFSALQTILGAILLFLFGLGIRNKFRMK